MCLCVYWAVFQLVLLVPWPKNESSLHCAAGLSFRRRVSTFSLSPPSQFQDTCRNSVNAIQTAQMQLLQQIKTFNIRNIHSWALSLLWQPFECSLWPQLGQRLETKRTCTFSWPTTEGWKEFMAVTQPIAMILPVTMTMLTTMKMMMKMVMMMVRLDQQQGLGAIYGSNPTAPKAGHSASICNICTSNTMAQCTCTVYSNSSTSSIRH